MPERRQNRQPERSKGGQAVDESVERGSRTDPDVRQAIERLAVLDPSRPTASSIRRTVLANPDYRGRVPESDRTIRAIVSRARAAMPAASDLWRLETVDPASDGARFVLDALAAIYAFSGGQVRSVSVEDARWIERVARARPDWKPLEWWGYARSYQREGVDLVDLDIGLALRESAIYEDPKSWVLPAEPPDWADTARRIRERNQRRDRASYPRKEQTDDKA